MWISDIFAVLVYYFKQALIFFWEKAIVALWIIIFTYLIWVYNAQQIAINSLLWLMVIDFLLWIILAIKKKRLSSLRMKLWLGKFIIYMFIIISGYWFDMVIFKEEVEYGLHYFFIVYLAVNELISIAEHTSECGLRLPIVSDLKKFQKELEKKTIFEIMKNSFTSLVRWGYCY